MGNKSLENSDNEGSRTNRSYVSTESNKIITTMLQRVHTQMENDQNTNSIHSNEKSIYNNPVISKSINHKQEFADTQQLFQNNSIDDSGIENYFSANEHSEPKPGPIKSKDNFANYAPSFTINNILSKQIPGGRQKVIQQPRINCNLQQKIFLLPNDVIYLIISFLIDHYNTLISISPVWYYKINEIMEESLIDVDNDFIKTHMQILSFKKSYFSITPLKLSKLGFRLDRNIIAEIFPCLEGQTVLLRYYYQIKDKSMNCAEFRFDVVKKGDRKIWIYKENFKHNYDQNKLGFVQPIIPIFANDNIKFSINFYNPTGLIDIKKIKWDNPLIQTIPKLTKTISSNFNPKTKFEIDRLCELETIHNEWIDPKYLDGVGGVLWDLNKFEPQLHCFEIKASGIETGIISTRIKYKANQIGIVDDCYDYLGVNIEILTENDECVNEVKRMGLVFDLEENLQLKVGDIIIFYLSAGS